MSKAIIASGPVIVENDHVLLDKSGQDDFWKFCGGKLKNNETFTQTAIRRAKEELGIDIKISNKNPFVMFVYKDTPEQLKQTNKELLKRLRHLNDGNCLVADLVNLDEDFIKNLKNIFGKRLIIKVIFPPIKTIIERDEKRLCWTSGEENIKRYYKQYQKLKEIIGKNNYIDNSSQNPEETYEKYFANLMLNMYKHSERREARAFY